MPARHRVHPRPTGEAYRKARRAVLDHSDICHLCGHPGAGQVDHLLPRSLGGSVADEHNLAPAHGGGKPDNPCPVCGLRCNQARGNGVVKRGSVRSRDW